MSAVPPPAVPPVDVTPPRAADPLAVTSLVIAIVAAAFGALSGPVAFGLQVRAGVSPDAIALGVGIPVFVLGVVALILGLVALSRPAARRGIAGAGAGLGGFLAVGQVVGLVTLLLLSLVR
jgi:hypothetical protein